MKTIILLIGSHVHEDHIHIGAVHTIFQQPETEIVTQKETADIFNIEMILSYPFHVKILFEK